MKVKENKVVLGKNDTRIGNFVLSKEKHHFKLQDVGGFWSVRISRFLACYSLIEECMKNGNTEYLEAMTKLFYAVTTTPPDPKMMEDMFNAYSALMERMKEAMPVYDDEQVLEEMQRDIAARETIIKTIEDGAPTNQEG